LTDVGHEDKSGNILANTDGDEAALVPLLDDGPRLLLLPRAYTQEASVRCPNVVLKYQKLAQS